MIILELLAMFLPMMHPAPQADLAMQAAARINVAAVSAADETEVWQAVQPAEAWRDALQTELAGDAAYADMVEAAIDHAVAQTGADPTMLWSVMYTESRGRHWSRPGHVVRGSSKEIGMMQVQPFWSRSIEKRYGLKLDLYDLQDNVLAGAIILSRGGETPQMILSYYNTGQRIRSSVYQRKVMRYWSKLATIPEKISFNEAVLAESSKSW